MGVETTEDYGFRATERKVHPEEKDHHQKHGPQKTASTEEAQRKTYGHMSTTCKYYVHRVTCGLSTWYIEDTSPGYLIPDTC